MTPPTKNRAHLLRGVLAALASIRAVSATAQAQWTVVNLHPAGASDSWANAVDGGQQVGHALFGVYTHACLWTGSAPSWVDLTPPGAFESRAFAVHGGQQAGWADPGPLLGGAHASLWSSSAAAWVDLNPVAPTGWPLTISQSYVLGLSGSQQVGAAYPLNGAGYWYASLWSGSEGSWVNLNPALAQWSVADDVDGGQQVGWARVSNVISASLWTGTAASWVSLNPAGAVSSHALAVSAGEQVGYARFGAEHAGLWHGSVISWVDLNPQGAQSSQALAVHGGQEAGYATINGAVRASVWSGTAASWTDLHVFAAANFSDTKALGIWHDSAATYVVGYGHRTSTQHDEALLWTLPHAVVTYCTAGTTTDGCVPSIGHVGTPSASAGSGFTITVAGVEGGQPGLILYGLSGQLAAPWGSGSSLLCVNSPRQRTPVHDSGGTPGVCDGSLALDWNQYIATHAAALGVPFSGGEIVCAQGWFRDPPAPKTTNLSNGLQFSLTP